MFLFTFLRTAPTKAFPRNPTPGDSSRPRAKITSTCGQAADADGIAEPPGRIDGPTSNPVATRAAVNAAITPRRTRCRVLCRSRRGITGPMLQTARGEVGRLSDEAACVIGGP